MTTSRPFRFWTTEQVSEAYLQLLCQGRLNPMEEAEMRALQQEWGRRPTRDRLAALRRQRDGLTASHAVVRP